MAFTSSIFLFVFFPLCLGGYYLAAGVERGVAALRRLRLPDLFLVCASMVFYAWAAFDGALWLVGYVLLAFLLGRVIAGMPKGTPARLLAAGCSVLVVVLMLVYFKYYNFSVTTVNRLFSLAIATRSIVAPLGVSFITFSAVSYFADISRGDAKPGSLLDTALYLTFFPKVISGPIAQWKDFAPFVNEHERRFDSALFLQGLNRIVIGFAKKLILADIFGALIAEMEGNLSVGMDQPTAWGVAFLYMLQIYYDFSAYSDIAIGLSELFGIRMKENFNFPYLSRSITEFWRRWHISLGTWFREYLYIPLGGNRKGRGRTLLNLFAVFLVTGIWHGAGYNYILWGVINGVMIVLERCVRDKGWYQKIPGLVKWAFTMFVVLMSWQVFRLESMSGIAQFFGILFGAVEFPSVNFTWQYYFDARIVVLMVIATVGALALDGGWAKKVHAKIQSSAPLFCVAQLALLLPMVLSVMFMVNSTYSPFIYFQY